MALWFCLFVRYRNHYPVVLFQNQAHIQNPHGMGQAFKTFAPNYSFFLSPPKAADSAAPSWAPQIFVPYFLLPLPKVAVFQMGAEGVAPPEGERNPAEGGCFASLQITK